GVIFECKVGPGRLLVSAIDLQKSDAPAGAQQLRRSLLARPTATAAAAATARSVAPAAGAMVRLMA
uniref:hypothetical protein n=1 Tax=uncultured Pseudacidovorax sp. TaxID=679313 RepID=UPI0025DA2865